MKAATGELNLTVITIIAIGAVLAFFMTILWPAIKEQLTNEWGKSTTTAYVEVINTDLV
jgi:hypothetical protein